MEECVAALQAGALAVQERGACDVMGRACDLLLVCRVIYLQVSMNEGLSYITSSVHITTTECVSTRSVFGLLSSSVVVFQPGLFHAHALRSLQSSHLPL